MDEYVILIVDDEPQNLHALIEILKDDYRVKVARNGEKALQIIGKARPDAVLLDVNMPGMDGYTVLERLQDDDAGQSLPVIFLSSSMSEADRQKGLELGAVDFVQKPVDADVLKKLIENTLGQGD
jgi:putative two-component system response regulator